MALDINTGYSSVFKTFVDFAEKTYADGYDSASAKATLSSRTITVSALSLHETNRLLRRESEVEANNTTRALFKAAICDMFGGENKIPQNVKDAMVLADYGHGRPLSSRRILAVKAAIDSNNATAITRAREQAGTSDFQSLEVKEAARALGFTAAELPKIARATELYMQYSLEMEDPPKSEMEAMREVARPGSKAARLAFYGGRFLENAENFRAGMKLLTSFAVWFNDVRDFCTEHVNDRADADTLTKQFMDVAFTAKVRDPLKGLEKVIFQELATNPDVNLTSHDREYLFGMENNAAMRFFGRDCHAHMLGAIFNVPPEKRRVLFAAFDAFMPLGQDQLIGNTQMFTLRVLNHFDELAELQAKGELTTKNIIKTCFPDMKKTGHYDLAALNRWFDGIGNEIAAAGVTSPKASWIVSSTLVETGCTVREAVDAFRNGSVIKSAAYNVGCDIELPDFADEGMKDLKGDLKRAYPYSRIGENGQADKILLPDSQLAHRLKFPDGTILTCNDKSNKEQLDAAVAKVKELCGEVHDIQARIVGKCLGQTALALFRSVMMGIGIKAGEHSALNYTLSKDEQTGAVTIRYSSPDALSVRFSWTCTVNTDGTSTTTPIVFEGDMKSVGKIPLWKAREMIADAEKRLGLENRLTAEQREGTAGFLAKYGANLPETTARILANYIVNIAVFGGGDEEAIARLANDMKKWRMFSPGDQRLDEMGRRFVNYQNEFVKYQLANQKKYFKDERRPELHRQFLDDAHRANWDINGIHFKRSGLKTDDIADAFLAAVKTPNARKAVSALLNQKFFADVDSILYKMPASMVDIGKDDEEHVYGIKGGDMFVSKTQVENDEPDPIVSENGTTIECKLDVSKDGKTAYLTMLVEKDLMATTNDFENSRKIGKVSVSIISTVDLKKDPPEVTDVTFAQHFTEKVAP